MSGPSSWVLAAWLGAGALAACDGCAREKTGTSKDGDVASAPGGSAPADMDGRGERASEDEGDLAADRDASHAANDGGRETRSPCAGAEIDLFEVLADSRCAITAREAKRLRAAADDAGAGARVVQRAVAEDDGTVTVRLTNAGSRALTVPLFDDARLPSFTILAQDGAGTLLELEPPDRIGAPLDSAPPRARIARARLVPGAALVVRLRPTARVVRRLRPTCPDGGRCGPEVLAPGAYVLHVGQLLADLEVGPPARVAFLFR